MKKGVTKVLTLSPDEQSLKDLDLQITDLLASIDQEELDVDTFRDDVAQLAKELADTYGIETEQEEPARFGGRPYAGSDGA